MTKYSKHIYLSLLLLFCASITGFSQTVKPMFMVPDVDNHDFHRKCGFDHHHEKKMSNDPAYAEWVEQIKNDLAELVANEQNNNGFVLPPVIDIPIVVHVIHNGEPIGTGANLSDARIQAQIDVLNDAFAAANTNFSETPVQWQGAIGNPEINFCLAVLDPNGNATNGITRDNITVTGTDSNNNNIETTIKPATWWDSDLYYNIWTLGIPGTTAGGGVTGYAYLPYNGTIGSVVDGSVVDYNWFGGPGFGQSGDGTLTHETGHYLGLFHTFDGDACGADDGLADTPNIDAGTSTYNPGLNCNPGNFPTGPTSCGNEHMYVNYMDYVNDDYCSTSFSNDQITVMRAVLNGTAGSFGFGSRLPLASNATGVCTFFGEDAGVSAINVPGSLICNLGQVTPEVEIINFGQNTLTSVTISYTINAGAPVDFSWTGSLLTGQSEVVTLAPYFPPGGNYTFEAFTQNPNGTPDGQPSNDAMSTNSISINPLNLPLYEDFEDPTWNPTINGVFAFNMTNDLFEWERTTLASGYGNGTACAMFDNFNGSGGSNPNNTTDALITPIYDFSSVTGGSLNFDVAYTYFDNTFVDTLIVLVSTNCGQNYITQVFVKGGADLATAPPQGFPFTPNATQWRTETIDLSAYDGFDNLSIAFVNFSGYGNRLFIDNINLGTPCGLTSTTAATDATCYGFCDGIASAMPSGGSGTYTYQWDANAGNATTQTVTGLCLGTYSVTIMDSPGCNVVNTITIGEPTEIDIVSSVGPVLCPDVCDGTIDIIVTGGTMPFSYLWSNGATSQNLTDLCAGPFAVTVIDGNGCTQVSTMTVPDLATFDLTMSSTPISGPGVNDATATANPTGGTPPYMYIWSNTETTQTISNLGPGTYIVTVTTSGPGCILIDSVVIADINCNGFAITVDGTPSNCPGMDDGTAFATVNTGTGTAPYTFSWDNGGMTDTIIDLSIGIYNVTATDANGCTAIDSFEVVELLGVTVSVTTTDETVEGATDGTASATAGGGTPPYNYFWVNGATTPMIMDLFPGPYDVTVMDANGCTASAFGVVNPGPPDCSVFTCAATGTNVLCNGDMDGTATAIPMGAAGPYIYNWDNGGATSTITGLVPNTYNVVVTAGNGCTASAQVVITEQPPLTVTVNTATDVSCFNLCDGVIDLTVNGGLAPFNFDWDDNSLDGTEDPVGLCAGIYVLTVTDANTCTFVETIVITEPPVIDPVPTIVEPFCNGGCDGSIDMTVVGGTIPFSYNWSNGADTEDIINLCADTYSVTITDDNGCSSVQTYFVGEPTAVTVTISSTPPTGSGTNDGTATAMPAGGTPGYSYAWSNFEITQTITNLAPGTYTVDVTDANGCSSTQSVVINPFDCGDFEAVANAINVMCNGDCNGMINLEITGGTIPFDFDWNDDDLDGIEDPTGLCVGFYEVTITDAAACSVVVSINVDEPGPLSVTLTGTPPSAPGADDATLTANPMGGTPGYSYSWNPTGEMSQTIINLGPGTYSVIVTDATGCTAENSIVINDVDCSNFAIDVMTNDEICEGDGNGLATVVTTGGTMPFAYLWDNGEMTQTITGLSEGTVMVTVTDANGCTLDGIGIVSAPPVIEIDFAVTDVDCNGALTGVITCLASGGQAGGIYTYVWSNGGSAQTIFDLEAGNYCVTVTDIGGCTSAACTDLLEPIALVSTAASTPESFPGALDGTAEVFPTGGTPPYTFMWDNGGTTALITGLSSGIYSCTITDANNCLDIVTVEVGIGSIDCTGFDMILTGAGPECFGYETGNATAELTGGVAPYTYLWNTGGTTATITDLSAGSYTCTVSDVNGCVLESTITLDEPPLLDVTVTTTNETAPGASDGTATGTPIGGAGPYTFLWCNGQTTSTTTGLNEGSCAVIVTDANGCTTENVAVIETNSADCSTLAAMLNPTMTSCFGFTDGTVAIFPQGGTTPYTYLWSNGEMTTIITDLAAGVYDVTLTDANGCTIMTSTFVEEPEELVVTTFSTNETTSGANDGTATAIASGGTPGYSYNWDNGGITSTITNLAAGIYTVTVTDINGCITESTIIVDAGNVDCSTIALTVDAEGVSCFEAEDGFAIANVSGGMAPYGYLWSNGEFTSSITDLPAGSYSVTISDINGCLLEDVIIIPQPSPLEVMAFSTDETTAGANDGTASVTATGGTLPYTYLWNTGETTTMISDLAPGTYDVVVTDANGCEESIFTLVAFGNVDCAGIALDVAEESVSCFGMNDGVAIATVTGGQGPYTYNWSNGATTATINGLPAGPYDVTITDAIGCSLDGAVIVPQPSAMVSSIEGFDGACGGNASASIVATGGTSPLSYLWSNGATDNFIGGLTAGVYSVTVTDAAGCTITDQVQVDVSSTGIQIENDVDAVTCFGESDGAIDLAMMQGTPPYTFQWTNGATTEDIDGLAAGSYSVLIVDAAGCSFLTTVEVGSPGILLANVAVTPADNGDNGTATAMVFGGTTPYTYNWSTGNQTASVDGLGIGTYSVTVTDANGCTAEESFNISITDVNEIVSLTSFELFPNPSNGYFQILADFNTSEQIEIEVYSVVGQLVYTRQLHGNRVELDVDIRSQPIGTYLLRMRIRGGELVRRIVVQ